MSSQYGLRDFPVWALEAILRERSYQRRAGGAGLVPVAAVDSVSVELMRLGMALGARRSPSIAALVFDAFPVDGMHGESREVARWRKTDGVTTSVGYGFCTECGDVLPTRREFCPSCGTAKPLPGISHQRKRAPRAASVIECSSVTPWNLAS